MQNLLSEHWHVVRTLRPRLRDGVQTLHRRLRGRAWVLLVDPVSQRFHRVTPAVWQVLKLLDGRRTLDDIWSAACAVPDHSPTALQLQEKASSQAGSAPPLLAAISQQELVQLIGSLHSSDLLQTQVAPDAEEVFERHRRQARQRFKQGWLNPMSIRVPLFYPDAWFSRHTVLARRLISWPVMLAWLGLVVPAGILGWQHWSELTENLSDRVLSANNVLLLWFIYPLVKAVHEWAHGMAVKAYGGAVREIGMMFVVLMPVPYVDATSSYRFPSKWARAMVAAAGIMAELVLGAIAMYVWLMAESGLVTAVAFNVLLIAGVSTLLVNGNPLMRYDGYYMLCDVIEIPNLGQRATQYWTYLIDRYAYGARDAHPPLQIMGERWILAMYGVLAPVYRLFITFGLIWFVASEYLFLGALMAALAVLTAVMVPLWKGWKHLHSGNSLARRRESAWRRTLLATACVVALLGMLPLPFHSVQEAVVWVPDEAMVRAAESGHVREAYVPAGSAVQVGQRLIRLDNPELLAELGVAAAAVAEVQAQLRQAEFDASPRVAPLRGEEMSRLRKLADVQARADGLTLVASAAGRWVPQSETEWTGRHVRRGDLLGYVVAGPSQVLRAAITQDDMDLIQSRHRAVEVRLAHALHDPVLARLKRPIPGGEQLLVSAALGTAGGGSIPVDPGDEGGKKALTRVFDVELQMAQPSSAAVFGERAYVRFDLGPAPLAWQWYLRLRQLFLERLSV
jgi:putative peptide zinc metalloprotease protein